MSKSNKIDYINSDKSYYICMIRRKRLLVKFEKYGILFIHEGHIELGQKIVVKYLLKNLNGMNNATKIF